MCCTALCVPNGRSCLSLASFVLMPVPVLRGWSCPTSEHTCPHHVIDHHDHHDHHDLDKGWNPLMVTIMTVVKMIMMMVMMMKKRPKPNSSSWQSDDRFNKAPLTLVQCTHEIVKNHTAVDNFETKLPVLNFHCCTFDASLIQSTL